MLFFWCVWENAFEGERDGFVCVCAHDQAVQQQPPPDCRTGVLSIFRLGLSPPVVAPGPMRFLISAAIVMKACSTFVAFLALVSRKGIAKESANSCEAKKKKWTRVRHFRTLCYVKPHFCHFSVSKTFDCSQDSYTKDNNYTDNDKDIRIALESPGFPLWVKQQRLSPTKIQNFHDIKWTLKEATLHNIKMVLARI